MARQADKQPFQPERHAHPSAWLPALHVSPAGVPDAGMLRSAKWQLLAADEAAVVLEGRVVQALPLESPLNHLDMPMLSRFPQ